MLGKKAELLGQYNNFFHHNSLLRLHLQEIHAAFQGAGIELVGILPGIEFAAEVLVQFSSFGIEEREGDMLRFGEIEVQRGGMTGAIDDTFAQAGLRCCMLQNLIYDVSRIHLEYFSVKNRKDVNISYSIGLKGGDGQSRWRGDLIDE